MRGKKAVWKVVTTYIDKTVTIQQWTTTQVMRSISQIEKNKDITSMEISILQRDAKKFRK